MSFYTALTGLNGSQADIAATSNNIANVGTTGFKRSRAEFGDIFATSPLQNSSSSIGSGSILKGVKQQFTQGNIAASLNALDLAISGQGFFALKPSLTSSQVVYTRNGSFNVDNNRNVVDSTGQFLLTYPVNEDGSVTSKTINDAVPLQLPVTSGEPKATSNIDLAINLPADAPVITDNPKFSDGYQFSTADPESFTNSTSLTIFDDLGNPTIATVYFIKTQASTADDPTNKYDTRLVIDETVINPDLVASVNDNNEQIYIDRFGNETTVANIPDDNYFSEGKGSALYRKDDLNQEIPSQPAKLTGSQTSFDFGEEGNKLIEITNDPMRFNATREAGNADSSVFWGKDFLLVNVDDGDVPVSVDLRPGSYNATQLASEVERAINSAYGDDNKLQVRSNVDDTLTVDFYTLNTNDGTLSGLASPVSIDLLASSYVTEQVGIETSGSSPDFTREEFLAHAQVRVIDTMNDYVIDGTGDLGVNSSLFTRSSGGQMKNIYEKTDIVTFDYASASPSSKRHLAYSYYDKTPSLSVYDNKEAVSTGKSIVYDSSNNLLRIDVDDTSNFTVGEVVKLAGNFDSQDAIINGRSLTILNIDANKSITINTTGEGFPDGGFTLQQGSATSGDTFSEAYILSDESTDVEAFFEGESLSPAGAVNSYNNKKIVLRETSVATHSYKHNEADAGAIDVSDAGSMVSGDEYYVTEIGTSDFNGATAASVVNAKDLNNGASGLGLIFTANATTLAGTGRVKAIEVLADLNGATTGQKMKVVAGTISDGTEQYNAGDVITVDATKTYAHVTAAAGVANVALDITNVAVAGDVTTLNIGTTTLTYTAVGAGESLATIVAGLTAAAAAATPAYTTATFAAVTGGIDITYAATGKQTEAITIVTSGTSAVTTTGTEKTEGADGGTAKLIKHDDVFSGLTSEGLGGATTLAKLGLDDSNFANATVWVDEKNPPIKVSYDAVNQRFEFGVNHTAIGPGTDSNFRAFKVYGAADADGTNNLGIPASDSSPQTTISSTAVIAAQSFVADGGEMQINAKRFGASVAYNSDTKTFTFLSGTTGETISADGALGVDVDQNASNIQVGRYSISATDGSVVNATFDTATRYMGVGDNGLMGVGASKNDTIFETARGLASEPASAIGAPATEPLNEIFNLSSAGNANVFNVSVNGISGIIEVPSGNYVGSTLAAELQTRINQISDNVTGEVVGGVTVKYQADANNFVFTTGTTGDLSTIKVKGAAKLGLDDVPLGVGAIPTIVNLVQATNDAGVPLYVNAVGEIVETPPDNLVTDYYPLYVDEGELTFDKTGQIISPLNRVHYEQQAAGFSISLDVDYSASTQLSQPFSVNNLEQDGFTSGRLDGLDIDATGLLRANYTNGENRPLGKIVLANFNNQNGLKQVGNATFVETTTSGTPTFGEAGAEGFGAIQSGSLERSNVDITEELVNLITAQRNFQASSKAIETSTQLTQAIINIRS
ncbi:flagellar hook-basal body complex protein [Rhodobacteraceae bacterium IMCC15231]|nr:flagellar hook-basal body complex protein [Rhodobacteraceae bacterium IMCC15231]